MAWDAKPRVKLPKSAAAGEVVTIRTIVSHPMESGQRRGPDGALVPRKIVNRFTCDFEGARVIEVRLDPGVSMNPFFEFEARVDRSGVFTFAWEDDDGSVATHSEAIEVA
jgi:sulfur-oxidizing protein SoxZ